MWILKGAVLIRGRRLFEVWRLLEEIRHLYPIRYLYPSDENVNIQVINDFNGLKMLSFI